MPEFRFHHLERRRLDQALPDLLEAALGWDPGRARNASKELSGEARAYLAASRQRGDVYIAGKTEQHQPGGVGVAMIYSEIDRAFIIVAEN